MIQLLISSEFYTKNIYFFGFSSLNLVNTNYFFLFILINSDKQVDTINPFNKWVMLGLSNLDPFNKHVGLVLTHIVKYS